MNKRLLAIIICILMVASALTGCFKKKSEAETTVATSAVETEGTDKVQESNETTIASEEHQTTEETLVTEETKQEEKPVSDANKENPDLSVSVEEWEDDDNEIKPVATKPQVTNPPETKPAETLPANPEKTSLTFDQYQNLSSADQQAYFESFDTMEAFLAWYDAAMKEYEESKNVVEIAGGAVDLGELMNKDE